MLAGTLHNQGTLLRCARIDAATAAESIDCSARTVHGWVPETADMASGRTGGVRRTLLRVAT